MEEQQPVLPEQSNQPLSEPTLPAGRLKNVDISKLFLPLAIIFAGVMISGAIVYINFSKAQLCGAGNKQQELNAAALKKWAKELKLTAAFNSCFDASKYTDEINKDIQDGSTAGVEGTPTFFINGTKIVGAQPFESFRTIIDAALAKPAVAGTITVSVDDDPVLGNAAAPVTMIEFSDFQCPFCLKFWQETFPQIKQTYIDTGKVKFVYRDFPLSFHPGAMPAAQAANCANEQGKYWEMNDLIFKKQI